MNARHQQAVRQLSEHMQSVLDFKARGAARQLNAIAERYVDLLGANASEAVLAALQAKAGEAGIDWTFEPSKSFRAMYGDMQAQMPGRVFTVARDGEPQTYDISTPRRFAQAMLAAVQLAYDHSNLMNQRQLDRATDILVSASKSLSVDEEFNEWSSSVLPLAEGRAAYELVVQELEPYGLLQTTFGTVSEATFRPFDGDVAKYAPQAEDATSPRP